jgi:hypothetical protein
MAIITKAAVSWGMYGGTSAGMRANLFSSWGLVSDLPAPGSGTIAKIRSLGLRLMLRLGL